MQAAAERVLGCPIHRVALGMVSGCCVALRKLMVDQKGIRRAELGAEVLRSDSAGCCGSCCSCSCACLSDGCCYCYNYYYCYCYHCNCCCFCCYSCSTDYCCDCPDILHDHYCRYCCCYHYKHSCYYCRCYYSYSLPHRPTLHSLCSAPCCYYYNYYSSSHFLCNQASHIVSFATLGRRSPSLRNRAPRTSGRTSSTQLSTCSKIHRPRRQIIHSAQPLTRRAYRYVLLTSPQRVKSSSSMK